MNNSPKINCAPLECSFDPKQLILCAAGGCVPSYALFQAAANVEIPYGAPVKNNPAGDIEPWAPGDDPELIIGFATGTADTTDSADCADICVLRRDAQLKADGIAWPAGTTQPQVAAVFASIDDRLRMTVRPVV